MTRRSSRKKSFHEVRSEFYEQPTELTVKSYINWFPGHMQKAMRQVKEKLKLVDIVLEIRDARLPLVSGNLSLQKELGQKKRLIVLNKTNLASAASVREWEQWFSENNKSYIFINSFAKKSLKRVLPLAEQMTRNRRISFEKKGFRPPPLRMMVVGVPNTGKSTIINRLTRHKATKTGDRPGVTKAQQWIVLDKGVELLDTPGIMPPRIQSEEQGFWLCAIHAIRDEIIGKEKVAYFVLEHLYKNNSKEFMGRYKITDKNLTTEELLEHVGRKLNCKKQNGVIDLAKASNKILLDFRKGELGRCSFEHPP